MSPTLAWATCAVVFIIISGMLAVSSLFDRRTIEVQNADIRELRRVLHETKLEENRLRRVVEELGKSSDPRVNALIHERDALLTSLERQAAELRGAIADGERKDTEVAKLNAGIRRLVEVKVEAENTSRQTTELNATLLKALQQRENQLARKCTELANTRDQLRCALVHPSTGGSTVVQG